MSDSKKQFWNTFLLAMETVPRTARNVRGVSGFVHPILAVGVDEGRARTLIVSGDPDARTAALSQADIQAAMPSTRIVMARPVAINLQSVALSIMSQIGSTRLPLSRIDELSKEGMKEKLKGFYEAVLNDTVKKAWRSFQYVELNTHSFWKELIQQISLVQVEGFGSAQQDRAPDIKETGIVIFDRLLTFDPVAIDRSGGVCAVPLYDLEENDYEALARGDADYARDCFLKHQVLQYFFPPSDQIFLAAAERGDANTPDGALQYVKMAPEAGHPLAANELVDPRAHFIEIVDALVERGLIVGGSTSLEVTPEGRAARTEVKFGPREGLMEKLSRIISIKVDFNLKDLFK